MCEKNFSAQWHITRSGWKSRLTFPTQKIGVENMRLIELKEIPLKNIIPCPLLIDRDDLGNLDEITGDIFTPPIVRLSKIQEGKYERITGLRRIKKAEKDKKETIWCLIYDMTDEEAQLVHAQENLQRKPLTVIEEGKLYSKLKEQLTGYTQEKLAIILTGRGLKTSQAKISNTMRLLKLAKPVQNYLALNKLGVGKGLLLLQVKDEQIQLDLAQEFISTGCSDEEAKEEIEKFKMLLTKNEARGQQMFHYNGSHYKPSREAIQPEVKFKLILSKPYCPRISEIFNEVQKLRSFNIEKCRCCPPKHLCELIDEYQFKLDLKEYREQKRQLDSTLKTPLRLKETRTSNSTN